MLKKILRVGNSYAVTLPKEFIKSTGLVPGKDVVVETDSVSKTVIIKEKSNKLEAVLTPEFFSWLKRIGKKYEGTIKGLAEV